MQRLLKLEKQLPCSRNARQVPVIWKHLKLL